jgi:large subunit ribosomal protein L19
MNIVDMITKKQIRTDLPEFRVGDTIDVALKILEKDKTKKDAEKYRIQHFTGVVTAIQGSGISKNFIVRKMSFGIGVERTIPLNSPTIESIAVVRTGKARQAKLRFLRDSVKEIKFKERN